MFTCKVTVELLIVMDISLTGEEWVLWVVELE